MAPHRRYLLVFFISLVGLMSRSSTVYARQKVLFLGVFHRDGRSIRTAENTVSQRVTQLGYDVRRPSQPLHATEIPCRLDACLLAAGQRDSVDFVLSAETLSNDYGSLGKVWLYVVRTQKTVLQQPKVVPCPICNESEMGLRLADAAGELVEEAGRLAEAATAPPNGAVTAGSRVEVPPSAPLNGRAATSATAASPGKFSLTRRLLTGGVALALAASLSAAAAVTALDGRSQCVGTSACQREQMVKDKLALYDVNTGVVPALWVSSSLLAAGLIVTLALP